MPLAAAIPPRPLLVPMLILAALAALALTLTLDSWRASRAIGAIDTPLLPAASSFEQGTPTAPATEVDSAALQRSELFGVYDPSAAASAASGPPVDAAPPVAASDLPPDDLPQATLGLTVQGVLFRPEAPARRAIIAGNSAEASSYRIGDNLPGDAVIRFIEAHRVVVEHGGRLETLPLLEPPGQVEIRNGEAADSAATSDGARSIVPRISRPRMPAG